MIRKRTKQRRGIPAGAVGQLRFGRDFFHSGWGDWTAETIELARAAWKDERIREKAIRDQSTRAGLPRCWAFFAFGATGESGLLRTIADAPAVDAAYRAEAQRIDEATKK